MSIIIILLIVPVSRLKGRTEIEVKNIMLKYLDLREKYQED
jgi:hypothetical protein